jgi:hypothetical protein
MADFRTKKRFETDVMQIGVDAGLPVGRYVFLLTVIDSDGNSSKPAKLNLEIIRGPLISDPIIRDPRLTDPVIPRPISPVRPRR